jgi:hypothetical protein
MPAAPAFTDDASSTDALTVPAGAYKVVFLAFPFEALGTASDKADLMHRVLSYWAEAVGHRRAQEPAASS